MEMVFILLLYHWRWHQGDAKTSSSHNKDDDVRIILALSVLFLMKVDFPKNTSISKV